MRYAQIRKYDVANGLGVRTTLFVSGCTHNCPNCFNKEYQDFKYGNEWTQETEDMVIEYVKDPNVKGLSLLGGEPFQQHPYVLYKLIRRVKEEAGKDVWVWTGYKLTEIPKQYLPLFLYIDVLVDGKFIEEQKNLKLKFRGSENQRVIDIPKSIEAKKIVLHKEHGHE